VPPPGAPDWERQASAWLFDICPGHYREYDVLRRHPVILARLAKAQVEAQIQAARAGWTGARVELRELSTPEVVQSVMTMYEREGARLTGIAREVDLIADALERHSRLADS
jgi:hypothetical protein